MNREILYLKLKKITDDQNVYAEKLQNAIQVLTEIKNARMSDLRPLYDKIIKDLKYELTRWDKVGNSRRINVMLYYITDEFAYECEQLGTRTIRALVTNELEACNPGHIKNNPGAVIESVIKSVAEKSKKLIQKEGEEGIRDTEINAKIKELEALGYQITKMPKKDNSNTVEQEALTNDKITDDSLIHLFQQLLFE